MSRLRSNGWFLTFLVLAVLVAGPAAPTAAANPPPALGLELFGQVGGQITAVAVSDEMGLCGDRASPCRSRRGRPRASSYRWPDAGPLRHTQEPCSCGRLWNEDAPPTGPPQRTYLSLVVAS